MRFVLLIALALGCGPSAQTPPTGTVVAGVQLVAPDPALRQTCGRAAVAVAFAVPCPGLIVAPRSPTVESCPSVDRPYQGGKDCVEDSAAGDPTLPSRRDTFTYVENDLQLEGALHLFVIGVRADSRLAPTRVGCAGPEATAAGPTLDGTATTWVECGEGSSIHAGHVLLRWERNGIIYVVSLHGHSDTNRAVELAIARAMEYVATP